MSVQAKPRVEMKRKFRYDGRREVSFQTPDGLPIGYQSFHTLSCWIRPRVCISWSSSFVPPSLEVGCISYTSSVRLLTSKAESFCDSVAMLPDEFQRPTESNCLCSQREDVWMDKTKAETGSKELGRRY